MDIAELRRLEAEATPGEWKRYDFYGFVGVAPVDEDEADVANTCGMTGETEDDRERALANAALIVAMRNALPELLKALEWQPIETAPRVPGNQILGYCPNKGTRETSFASCKGTPSESKTDGWWQWHEPANNWVQSWAPTHWMPLPLPPHGGVDVG